jgi:hypothetical protein
VASNPDQLVTPVLDGLVIDSFIAKFSGSIHLDPTVAGDMALIDALRLGRRVRVEVQVDVDGTPGELSRDKGGNIKTVSDGRKLVVRAVNSHKVLQEPVRGGPQTLDEAIPPEDPPKSTRRRRADRGETPSRSEQARVGAHLAPVD